MKYLLDTHVWVWLLEGDERVPPETRRLLNDSRSLPFGLSAISPWEIAKKMALGKLTLSVPGRDWIRKGASLPGIDLLPLTPEIAWEADHLPGEFHRDPADQIIAATARIRNITLITRDRRLLAYSHVRTREWH